MPGSSVSRHGPDSDFVPVIEAMAMLTVDDTDLAWLGVPPTLLT